MDDDVSPALKALVVDLVKLWRRRQLRDALLTEWPRRTGDLMRVEAARRVRISRMHAAYAAKKRTVKT